ncbi:MAG: nucleoside deaminase [Bacteroidales bacterium]|nr:nucleoside deaminase [Bacteroidales bacterium]MDD4603558.1 nucleoside deaminase [Bacteroidales bacterium]
MSEDFHHRFLDIAFKAAFASVRSNKGGPFGAVIVKDGHVIGNGVNSVISNNDPTAHAEIMAIRDACRNIANFDLEGSVIYSTCEPCPMCLSAIYWANISEVYYCSTKVEAAEIGFRDHHIYDELSLPSEYRNLPFHKLDHPQAAKLFLEWQNKEDKTPY